MNVDQQTGSIRFNNPDHNDQGFYQCFASNPFGTAVSNRVHIRMGCEFLSISILDIWILTGKLA
jgi:hypothetical protein